MDVCNLFPPSFNHFLIRWLRQVSEWSSDELPEPLINEHRIFCDLAFTLQHYYDAVDELSYCGISLEDFNLSFGWLSDVIQNDKNISKYIFRRVVRVYIAEYAAEQFDGAYYNGTKLDIHAKKEEEQIHFNSFVNKVMERIENRIPEVEYNTYDRNIQ